MKTITYALTLLLCFTLDSTQAFTTQMQVSPEKQVTFYPSYGYQQDDQWQIPLRIWVREAPDLPFVAASKIARRLLQKKAGLDRLTAEQKQRFKYRIRAFIADRESSEQVQFVFDNDPDNEVFQLSNDQGESSTDFNGLLEGTLSLSQQKADVLLKAQQSTQGWLRFHAVSMGHQAEGKVRLIVPMGESIISDIDDTIKVTEIPKGHTTILNNTFFQPFKAAPYMAKLYQDMGDGMVFHYVSGSPWQLYTPLSEFLFSNDIGFPLGSIHMKNVRTNLLEGESYQDFWKLLAGGSKQTTFDQKVGQISTLLEHFPQRTFTLIGDSGERDPEIFRFIRDKYPAQISEIRIRDVLNDPQSERLEGMVVLLPE